MSRTGCHRWRWAARAVAPLALVDLCRGSAAGEPVARSTDPTAAAHAVFQQNEFWWKRLERVETPLSTSWLQLLLSAVAKIVNKIIEGVFWLLEKLWKLFQPGSGQQPVIRVIVWVAAGLAVAWAVWRIYPLVARWLRNSGAPTPDVEARKSHELPQADRLFHDAVEALSASRYAEAIRLTILALIARLEQRGLLRYDPARTNREYQVELRPAPALAALFGEVARPFERVWYGGQPATRAAAEQVIDVCRPVITAEGLRLE